MKIPFPPNLIDVVEERRLDRQADRQIRRQQRYEAEKEIGKVFDRAYSCLINLPAILLALYHVISNAGEERGPVSEER